ncbi:MAG: MerR family transcriptional regulator [Jatrophihabitans sp.]|uniref:MerR family transcriptional regulator n=1 Tax=Jatrophihabitans sp. TaxID=1932789 RepID=UPI003F8231F6
MATDRGVAGVEAVLAGLRRGPRQLTRDPRGTIEAAVKQLLSLRPRTARPADRRTYRIDDLARAAGTTVRNVRAYQERGLLHAPTRVGRTAVFDDSHLSRLKIITSMLERGYTSAHIHEMLTAWESGRDLADVLGLERAMISPQLADEPRMMSRTQATELAGGPDELARFVAAGLVEVQGTRLRVLRPRLLEAFAEMRGYGLTNERLVALHRAVVPEVDRIGRLLVEAGVEYLAPRLDPAVPPSAADVDDLVNALGRFRALAMTSVAATLATSIEQTIEGLLADYLAHYVRAHTDTATG